jgi:small GTP-binding protein
MASAPSFTTDRIRNVVVVGHGGAGKTTLIDACCHASGATRRHGSAADGTALTMFTPEEIAHGCSMNTSVAHATWLDAKVNFIDTPGYLDFLGEARAGVRVADGALVVLSAPGGVEVGTERAWEMIAERELPAILFVSMMDRPNADFERVYQDVREHLTPKAIPVEVPIGSGESFRGIVNLFSDRAHFYTPGTQTASTRRATVPAELQATVDRYYAELIETIAATDDTLLEHYLEGDTITRDEAIHALKQAMLRGELYPLFCGAPTLTYGVRALLTKVVELLPSPQERPAEIAEGRGGTTVELRGLNSDPFCALVFKTTSEPHVGELSFFRVFGGSVRNGDEVGNATRDKAEKLSHLSVPQGRERLEVEELRAGDIGVVAKLRDTHTNDTLAAPAHPLILEGVRFPSRTSPSRWRAPRAATRTSSRWACTSCTRKTPASPPSTTPSWARPSPAAWASSTWRCSWSGSSARRGSASWCARRASPTARRSGRSPKATGGTRSRRAGADSSATRTCASNRSAAATATASPTRWWAASSPASTSPRWTRACRRRPCAACSPASRWWTSRPRSTSAATTRSILRKRRSRWRAPSPSRRPRRAPSR